MSNGTFGNPFGWHQIEDHTLGDTNGKLLVVNASFFAGEFYRTTVSGLCEGTTYEFSAWLVNLLIPNGFCSTQPGGTIPINVRFEIWDGTDTNLLASGNTGNIVETDNPNWIENGLVFKTLVGQDTVILKMINNGIGGCGNDLAIDDIEFKTCGDNIGVTDTSNNNSISICSGETPFGTTLTATPDNSVFNNHFYQWQESNNSVTWNDISGETNQSITVANVNNTMYYRARVAETLSNLTNVDCITFSDIYAVTVIPVSSPPDLECWETAVLDNTTCSWIVSGTQPSPPTGLECWEAAIFNNTTCIWDITGTQPDLPADLQCWQTAVFNNTSCSWDIEGTEPEDAIEEDAYFCENTTVTIRANVGLSSPEYLWDNGAMSEEITVDEAGIYTVEITSVDDCFTIIKTITVVEISTPEILSVASNGFDIVVTIAESGDYEYSLDGVTYQQNNVFTNVEGGLYTVYARYRNQTECGVTTIQHIHFVIPKFFTPNNDGVNDTFKLKGIELFESSEVAVFDRYGKLLKSVKNQPFAWDGTFINQLMPTSDYWYVITINGQEFKGHFTLKR